MLPGADCRRLCRTQLLPVASNAAAIIKTPDVLHMSCFTPALRSSSALRCSAAPLTCRVRRPLYLSCHACKLSSSQRRQLLSAMLAGTGQQCHKWSC